MSVNKFELTEEQYRIIHHSGSAIVRACPGAGKTRVLIARVRRLLADDRGNGRGRGIAMLSFTRAAISELQARLMEESLLPSPSFPHFLGTFDSFIWKFLVTPLGIPDLDQTKPVLIPDKDCVSYIVPRYKRSVVTDEVQAKPRAMSLSLFIRKLSKSGEMTLVLNRKAAQRAGFELPDERLVAAYENTATYRNKQLCEKGWLNYADARMITAKHLTEDSALSRQLAVALAARFREVLVDESQDCNPEDLQIINWLRDAGIVTKVVCDPHQSIFSFRDGIGAEHLERLKDSFDETDRLEMTRNFRSSQNICHAIRSLRPSEHRDTPLTAEGTCKDDPTPVYVLAYGTTVTSAIGEQFKQLLQQRNLDPINCPVLAATKKSVANAVGRKNNDLKNTTSPLLRLAKAVIDFHFPSDSRDRIEALAHFHEVTLELAGKVPTKAEAKKRKQTNSKEKPTAATNNNPSVKRRSYLQYLQEENIRPETWRPSVISHIRQLSPSNRAFLGNAKAWYQHAKQLLDVKTDNDLKYDPRLEAVLAMPTSGGLTARTIHSVKGLEFPAVCVVMPTAKRILDFQSGLTDEHAEDAREIYVGTSRAKSLLVIAVPQSQAKRLQRHLKSAGVKVESINLLQGVEKTPAKPIKGLPKGQPKRGAAEKTSAAKKANLAQRQARKPNPGDQEKEPLQLLLL